MGTLYRAALVLVIIGAVNWGLIGFFQFDLVAAIFGGQDAAFSRLVYALVGLAGLASIPILMKPLDEEEGTSYTRVKPNYGMEAGREEDFSAEKRKKNNNNNNNNNNSNSNSNNNRK